MRSGGESCAALAVALWLIAIAGAAHAAEALAAEPADLIVTNARVYTMDPERPTASAFAVRDGRFVAVGDQQSVERLRGERTRGIDAGGRALIPGLNDSHLHAIRGGRFYNLELRWDGVDSLARALERVREQAARTPPGQ